MNILYITDVNYIGKFSSDFSFGFRPFMSWVPALDATHCSYYRLNELDPNSQFDIAIVGSLNSTLLNPNKISLDDLIYNKVKKISKKIVAQQESYHRGFIHDSINFNKTAEELADYYSFLSKCDAILTHNKIDSQYFYTLLNKPCFVHPQLIIPIEDNREIDFNKPNNFILSANLFRDKGGAVDGYFLAKEFSYPIYSFGGSEVNLPLLTYIPYDSDYGSFNKKLSEFKIGINVPVFPIGGSFPLQCAMNKVPCVGWNSGDPLYDCFPTLTEDYPNFDKLKNKIKKLLTEKQFYIDVTEEGYKNFNEKYSFEKYIDQITIILNNIVEI